jgi:hypothetical protein
MLPFDLQIRVPEAMRETSVQDKTFSCQTSAWDCVIACALAYINLVY